MRPIICADVIARYGHGIVIVERLGSIPGFALPGGKQDPLERLSTTAIRELKEETGLDFVPEWVLGTYGESGRDPRGEYVSTVFVGSAVGVPCDEPKKSRILILTEMEILKMRDRFVFDHFRIFEEYLSLS